MTEPVLFAYVIGHSRVDWSTCQGLYTADYTFLFSEAGLLLPREHGLAGESLGADLPVRCGNRRTPVSRKLCITILGSLTVPYSFPPPKRFANALLRSHDITALIRDTEAHERALFRVAPPDSTSFPSHPRRSVIHGSKLNHDKLASGTAFLQSRRQYSSVATILGVELGEQLRNEAIHPGKERGEIDVELLLQGAERLSGI